jgi:hypothetical protein
LVEADPETRARIRLIGAYADDEYPENTLDCAIKFPVLLIAGETDAHIRRKPWRIDDHINYLMIRYDPDKVTPLRSEVQSKDYLSKPAPR